MQKGADRTSIGMLIHAQTGANLSKKGLASSMFVRQFRTEVGYKGQENV